MKIMKIRRFRFREQGGICYYCCQPMWEDSPHAFAELYGLNARQTKWLRSTAEHLLARCDSGSDHASNIAAACFYCNSRRHRSARPLLPAAYAVMVRRRLESGRWHGLRLRELPSLLPAPVQSAVVVVKSRPKFPPSALATGRLPVASRFLASSARICSNCTRPGGGS